MYHYYGKPSTYNIFNGFDELSPILAYVPYSYEQILKIKNIYNKNEINIGQRGFIVFITDYNDTSSIFDPSDMEEETLYDAIGLAETDVFTDKLFGNIETAVGTYDF